MFVHPQRGKTSCLRVRPYVELLETRALLSASPTLPPLLLDLEPNDILSQAALVGSLDGGEVLVQGTIGNSATMSTDVDWYAFTLDEASDVHLSSISANGVVLGLYRYAPFDTFDVFAQRGVLTLAQDAGDAADADIVARLGAGTYYVAVSGAGNQYFNALLAGSGYDGASGAYTLAFSAQKLFLDAADGPVILSSNPSDGSVLQSSPFVLRLNFSNLLDAGALVLGENIRLTYNAAGSFGDGNDVDVGFDNFFVSDATGELQLLPSAPLVPGFYQLFLAGDLETNFSWLADLNGVPLGANAAHPFGQDMTIAFQVAGSEGTTDMAGDDVPGTARDLGDVTNAGLVQYVGAIGDDAGDGWFNPSDVDLYHFQITGSGNFAVSAEVFARRIGSPLNSGLSLFHLNADAGLLELVAGNDDTLNSTVGGDGRSLPLLSDSALLVGLMAGDYYLAVSSRKNVPDPTRGLLPGEGGIFDPNAPDSGFSGTTIGAYVLNVFVQADNTAPRVVEVASLMDGSLAAPPTQIVVRFSEDVNLQQLAFAAYQQSSHATLSAVYIEDTRGTRYFPRLVSFDDATHCATFQVLDALPNGTYTLHLSGSLGLADFAGNPLEGNGASGDYVMAFTVAGAERGTGDDPLHWNTTEPNDSLAQPQDLGVLFPHELESGVTITRTTSTQNDFSDFFRIVLLQDQSYLFMLNNLGVAGLVVTIFDDLAKLTPTSAQGASGRLAILKAGTYFVEVSGWNSNNAGQAAYELRIQLGASAENPPPLTIGPAPIARLRLSDALPSETPPVLVLPGAAIGMGGGSGSSTSFGVSLSSIFSALGRGPLGGVTTPNGVLGTGVIADRTVLPRVDLSLTQQTLRTGDAAPRLLDSSDTGLTWLTRVFSMLTMSLEVAWEETRDRPAAVLGHPIRPVSNPIEESFPFPAEPQLIPDEEQMPSFHNGEQSKNRLDPCMDERFFGPHFLAAAWVLSLAAASVSTRRRGDETAETQRSDS